MWSAELSLITASDNDSILTSVCCSSGSGMQLPLAEGNCPQWTIMRRINCLKLTQVGLLFHPPTNVKIRSLYSANTSCDFARKTIYKQIIALLEYKDALYCNFSLYAVDLMFANL